jgi:hypothetical protein
MTVPARHDPSAPRPRANPDLISRAQRHMLDTETPRMRYLRQHCEDALGALRVTMDCLREVCPLDLDVLTTGHGELLISALDFVEGAYVKLDELSPVLLGVVMDDVQAGRISTHEQLDQMGVPQ